MVLALLILMLAAQTATTPIVVVGEKLPVIGDRAVFELPGLNSQPADLLTFEQAFEINRGNQLVLQALRNQECAGQSSPACGSQLPVRARRSLDHFDQLAAAYLTELAEMIQQASSPSIPASIVFASSGLPYRIEPKKAMEAVRDAIKKSGARFNIVASADGEGLAGLKRLAAITGVAVITAEPEALKRLESEPLPVATAAAEPAESLKGMPPIIAAATRHVSDFAERARTLIADEHNVQEIKAWPSMASTAGRPSMSGMTVAKRILDSEVALVSMTGELWLMARDILRVDGKPVPAAQRVPLPAPRPGSTAEATAEFKRIAQQGARFNLGAVHRDLNTPTLTLWLLTPQVVSRFSFSAKGQEKVGGRTARIVEFKERQAPYLFGVEQVPTPVTGRFWIEPSTGIVLKSELLLVPNPARNLRSRALLTVTFALDPAVNVWVPHEMTERYDGNSSSNFETSISTYTNYRQFGTSARIVQ